MSDSYRPRLAGLLLVAGFLTLVVTVLRLVGERQGWDSRWFSAEPLGRGSLLGIVWLVPIFGALFGRRLAQSGSKPAFVASFFVPMFAASALLIAAGYIATQLEGADLRTAMSYLWIGGGAAALLGLFAWPRAFAACLAYGLLARAPVVLIAYLDVVNGWQTHYGKLHPDLPPMSSEQRLWLLGMAQAAFWVPLTILLGGGAAALGAATVKKG